MGRMEGVRRSLKVLPNNEFQPTVLTILPLLH